MPQGVSAILRPNSASANGAVARMAMSASPFARSSSLSLMRNSPGGHVCVSEASFYCSTPSNCASYPSLKQTSIKKPADCSGRTSG